MLANLASLISLHIDSADLVLLFGPSLSDTNTMGWSTVPDPQATITFHKTRIETESTSQDLQIKNFMRSLLACLKKSNTLSDKRSYPPLGSP